MRVRFVFTTLALALIAACAPKTTATTGSAADEEAIRGRAAVFADAWNKGDTKTLSAMMSDDIHEIEGNGEFVEGKAAWEKGSDAAFAIRPAGQSLTIETKYLRWIDANSAATGGTWTLAGAPAGAPTAGTWSNTLVRAGTGWNVITSHVAVNYVPPAPMAADTSKVVK